MIRNYIEEDYDYVYSLGKDIDNNYIFRLSDVSKCFIYEFERKVVAFVIIDVFMDRSEIIDICVSPLYRNGGIGNMLLNYALDYCKEKGCASVTLEVKCTNETALKLYTKNNFQIVSIRKNYYDNGRIDAYLMFRKL